MAVTKRRRVSKSGKVKFSYQAEVIVRGSRVSSKSFPTMGEAHTWHDIEKQKYLDKDSNCEPEVPKYTVAEAWIFFQEKHVRSLRESSHAEYEVREKYILASDLAELKVESIRPHHIDQWLDWMRSHKTAFSKHRKSFKKEVKILCCFFNWYKQTYNYKFFPPIQRHHYKKALYKTVKARRPDFSIKQSELPIWLNHLKDSAPIVYFRLAKLMVMTGLRMGEATGLYWDAIDFEQKTLSVTRTLSWRRKTKEPYVQECAKNQNSIRTIPLPNILIEMLSVIRKEQLSLVGAVFRTPTGLLLRNTVIRQQFNKSFKACDLDYSGTHVLRHTFATMSMQAVNGDLGKVQLVMGHRSRVTTELYAKSLPSSTPELMEKTSELLNIKGV